MWAHPQPVPVPACLPERGNQKDWPADPRNTVPLCWLLAANPCGKCQGDITVWLTLQAAPFCYGNCCQRLKIRPITKYMGDLCVCVCVQTSVSTPFKFFFSILCFSLLSCEPLGTKKGSEGHLIPCHPNLVGADMKMWCLYLSGHHTYATYFSCLGKQLPLIHRAITLQSNKARQLH